MSGRSAVVFVHGLWMTGRESVLLRRRLASDYGFDVHRFHYRSIVASMEEIVLACARFVRELDAPRVHLVGHSLGGLVIYELMKSGLLESGPRPAPPLGRIVFLGTPCMDCRCGRVLGSVRFGRAMLGRAAAQALLTQHDRRWDFPVPLGIVAGNLGVGLGRFIVRLDSEHDGTITVDETRMPGATDHVVLPVSHTGMLVAPRVAHAVGSFLTHGRFVSGAATAF